MSPRKTKRFSGPLNQTAVYWGTPTPDGYGGRTFVDPVELLPGSDNGVRWEERAEKFIDLNGEEAVSRAVIYVAQDCDIGGYLFLGDLDDLSSGEEADPQTVADAWEIRGWSKIPTRDARGFLRKAWIGSGGA